MEVLDPSTGVSGGTLEPLEQVEEIADLAVEDDSYPFYPKSVAKADLPFIPAEVVKRMDGEGTDRLCMFDDHLILLAPGALGWSLMIDTQGW